jgi:nicotine blue oxidoreductase
MIVGLLLAAGSGSRMGVPKALVEIDGIRLVDRALKTFHDAGITEVFVVLGAWVGEIERSHIVVNPEWEEGMGSSLRAGLVAISEFQEYDSVLISLVDIPGITAPALARVALEPATLAMGEFEGRAGHPVKIGREHWQAVIESARGDIGARNFLKGRSDIRYIPLADLATGNDLDTPEDLASFLKNS